MTEQKPRKVGTRKPRPLSTEDQLIINMSAKGYSYAEIGAKLGRARQSVQRRARQLMGTPDRRWPATKEPNAVHTAEVRVRRAVNRAALARLDELAAKGLGRYTMRELCRRAALLPLDDENFPALDKPFTSAPPGSRGGREAVTLRWETRWGEFETAQKAIHARGYSLSEVVEQRLKHFAKTGDIPPDPRINTDGAGSSDE